MNVIPCEAVDLASIGDAVLSTGARLRFRARGFSMHPLIADGDILLVEPVDPAHLCIGDVVLFKTATMAVWAHRLVKKERDPDGPLFTMRGDARPRADCPVGPEHVLGRVVAIERHGRSRSLERGWAASIGMLFARLPDPVVALIYRVRTLRHGWKRATRERGL